MKTLNTVKARHMTTCSGACVVYGKEYAWHIPRNLRELNIQKGDIVFARSNNRWARVYVCEVYREELEETGVRYKAVVGKPKNADNLEITFLEQLLAKE